MQRSISLFALFGGIRPMAAALRERPSTVYTWRTVDRIPADKQRRVIEIGIRLGLAVTPELVIFPSGNIPETVRAICAHRPRVAPRTIVDASDRHGVGAGPDRKYGNRTSVLDTCDQMVAA